MYQIIILTLVASCTALPTDDVKPEKLVKDCANGILSPTCLKIGAITLIERLNKNDEVSILPGVSLVKEASDKSKYETVASELARSLTGKADEKLDKYLLYHVGNFLDTHSVKFRLLGESSLQEDGVMGEGRAKSPLGGGKKGGMGGIIAMAMMMKVQTCIMYRTPYIFIIASVLALPNPETKQENVEVSRSLNKDCSNGIFSPTCLKIEAISLLERLSSKDELRLLPGVSVVKEANENGSKAEEFAAELARSLPTKPDERLDKFLLFRLGDYLDSHTVRLRLLDDTTAEEARSLVGEARGKGGLGGKKGGMGGLIAAALMMKGTLMSIGLGALALLAGKALMTAMMSLLLSAVIGLKSLSGGQKSTTYEIVSKPVYSHSHSHSTAHEDVGAYGGHSGYGRGLKDRR